MRILTTLGVGFFLLTGCASPAPDIHGTVELSSRVVTPPNGTLTISAGPVTRASEGLEMETISIPVSEVTFPHRFVLRGSGDGPGNRSWSLSARVLDPATSEATLQGTSGVWFECTPASEGGRCDDAEVRVVLDPVQSN